jgi:DNA-directed RNA polymerase II subunit RPB1
MYIYLNNNIRESLDMANKIASHIKYTTLQDLRDKVDIYYDPDPYAKDGFMEKDNVFNIFYGHNPGKHSCQPEINNLPWLIRMVINKEMLLQKDITLLDIKATFCNNWERRYKDNRGLKKEEKQLLEKITQAAILSNSDNDKVPIIHLRFDMTEFDFSTIIAFLDVFVESFKLKGLEGIEKINTIAEEQIIDFNNENQDAGFGKHQVIYTAGVNMIDIRYINGIDIYKTICNDVVQIYEQFGIEAARMALLNEIRAVFEGAGNRVNFQHISILIDIMTNNGTLTQIDRHGLNRVEIDPLARASFEKTVEQLINAAVFGETDHMKSVSSRIMAGLVIKAGTGVCNVVLDTNMLENSEYIEDVDHKYKKTFAELTSDPVVSDTIGSKETTIFLPED